MRERPPHDDQLSEAQVTRILHLAARLQESQSNSEAGVTLADVERAAAEAGIDSKYVRTASLLLDDSDDWPGLNAVLGASPRLVLNREISAPPKHTDDARITASLEPILGPTVRREVWNGIGWDSTTPGRHTQVTVVFPRNAARVVITEDLSGAARSLFTGVIAGVGVAGGGLAFGTIGALTGSIRLSLLAAGFCLAASVVVASMMNRKIRHRRASRLTELAERIVTVLYT